MSGSVATANAGESMGANLKRDDEVLKFTQDGKLLLKIGHPDQSKGSNDIENLKGPAKMFVDPETNGFAWRWLRQ
jgi:hypothetical protein